MINKIEMVNVPRELLERFVQDTEDHCYGFDGRDEIRALLAAPAEDVRAVVEVLNPDEIHQMAFEEGQPADSGDGYLFTIEEFDLFVQRLLDRVQQSHAQRETVIPDLDAFERSVINKFGFASSKLCLLNGEDLHKIWNACIDEFKRLNP